MISRVMVTVAMIVVVAASCTTEESSTPGPTLTSTTSTTSTTIPATSTTTEPIAETTAAQPPPVTEPASTLPAGPADALVPLLIGAGGGGWLYLGAWQFDQWIDPVDANGDPVAASIGPGTAVSISNLDTDATGQLGESADACVDDRVGPTVDVAVPAPEPPGFGYAAVAVPTPTWALTPRPLAVSTRGPASYKELGVAAFDGDPVDASKGEVVQVVVTDLDGDGDDEAIAVFEYAQPESIRGTPGDLSSVLLVDATSRESSAVLQSFVDQGLGPDEFPLIERFRILDVADYNGDGKMEVAVHAWYYEGSSVIVYEYDGTTVTEVLAAGCGS